MLCNFRRSAPQRRGSALATLVLCVLALSTLAAGLAFVGLANAKEQRGQQQEIHSDFICQAGLAQSMYQLNTGVNGNVGSHANPASWGGSRYWVAATNVTPDVIRLTATGIDDHSGASQELTVRAIPNTIWRYGAFGREWLHEDSNARVDSYNSTLGTYAAQDVNGNGSNQHALSNGDVGSNGDVSLDQNADVWGDSFAGPSHTTTILGNAMVSGSTTPASQQVTLPTINVPTYASNGNLTVTNNQTLASGNYNFGTLTINSSKTLTINGPANVVTSSMTLKSNSNVIVNAVNGPVTFYVVDNFVLNQNAVIRSTTYSPLQVRINLLSDNVINPEVNIQLDQVDFLSNSQIYGTILAPNARVTLNSNFEVFGAFMARSFDIHSNARFHFDEALLNATANGIPTYETVCWREIPYQK